LGIKNFATAFQWGFWNDLNSFYKEKESQALHNLPRLRNSNFFSWKMALQRSTEIVNSGLLIAGTGSRTESAVILFNRIQQLRAQKTELKGKQGLIILDPDLKNVIRAVDNEIQRAQGELEKLGRKISREQVK
jgi:hypothetical protein